MTANDFGYNALNAQVVVTDQPDDTDGPDGAFTFNNGIFNYVAPTNWDLLDTFKYRIQTSGGISNEATVTLTFQNAPPNGLDDGLDGKYATLSDVPLVVSAADGVLKNDYDIDLSNTAFPTSPRLGLEPVKLSDGAHGTVNLQPTGAFTYTPTDPDWHGTDVFTYYLFDTLDGQLAMADIYVVDVWVNVNALHVTHNGADVTENPGETVIGMKNALTSTLLGPGFGKPTEIRDVQWTIPGSTGDQPTAIKGYEISTDVAEVTKLTAADLSRITVGDLDNPGFYWAATFAPASVSATATIRVGTAADHTDYSTTAEGEIVVVGPTGINITSEYGEFYHPEGSEYELTPPLGLGDPFAPGITFRYTATAPSHYAGGLVVIQTVSSVHRRTRFDGTVEKFSTSGNFLLDEVRYGDQQPGEGSAYAHGGSKNLPAGGQVTLNDWLEDDGETLGGITDWPTMWGEADIHKQLKMNDNFADFLMYRPLYDPQGNFLQDSIYVPVWKFRWGFEASLVNTGNAETPNWNLDSDSNKDATLQGPTTQFPEWTTSIMELFVDTGGYQPESPP